MKTSSNSRDKRIFFGWYIVAGAAIQAFFTSATFFFGFTAFFNPISNEFGFSKAATAAALSLQRTESGIVGPFVGFLVDRYGARGVMLTGTIVTALGFFALARISSLTTFYLSFGLLALGIAMATMITTTPVIVNWFVRMRARALTFAFAGGASGGLAAPLIVWAISTYGWRTVLDWMGIGTLLVGIPVSLVMRHRPEKYGYLPDGLKPLGKNGSGDPDNHQINNQYNEPRFTIGEILKTRALWMLIFGMGMSGMVMSITVVMIIPALESYGLSTTAAGFAVMALAIGNVTGRILLGFMADKMNKRNVLCFTYVMFSLGALVFGLITELWHLAIFIPLYSLAHGGTAPVRFALLADYFGSKSYGSLVGITMTLTAIFGIIGPVFTGIVFDMTGSYRPAFLTVGLLMIPTIPITLLVKPPTYKA